MTLDDPDAIERNKDIFDDKIKFLVNFIEKA